MNDKSKANKTIKDALGKAITNKGALDGVWAKMVLLFGVAKDYVNGDYTEIPKVYCSYFRWTYLFFVAD